MIDKSVTVSSPDGAYPVHGTFDPAFEPLFDAFVASFATGQELGASTSINAGGRVLADLWGGWQDAARTTPWQRNTICNAMSVTKAMTATCLHVLVDRGLVEGLLVRWLLDQRAGLPVLEDKLWPGAIFDWKAMVDALAAQKPIFPPGTVAAYHIRTSGFLIGELVRRITGKSLGEFFEDTIAKPCGIDFHIGLHHADMARCAEFVANRTGTLLDATKYDPNSLTMRAAAQMPSPMDYNGETYRAAEIPSSNGHGNGRSVARFYAMLAAGGTIDGVRVLGRETLEAARVEQHHERELIMGRAYRQALGYLLNTPEDFPVGPNPNAFGLHGLGGALGFCDPDRGFGFGYIENRMHGVMGLGPRAPALLDAAYSRFGASA
jgi:CubicO group peptidase (beta-lactamase class C family)